MPEYKHTIEQLGILSHECNHISMFVLDKVGIPATPIEHESLCYLQGYYFKNLLLQINNQKEK